MSIDRERYTGQRDILNPPRCSDWGKLLGLSAADAEDLTQQGIEVEYDEGMNQALGQISRVAQFLSKGNIASFSLSSGEHTERAVVVQDYPLAEPGAYTVFHNKTEGGKVMRTSIWIIDATYNCIAYRYDEVYATEDGYWEPGAVPILEPEDEATMDILVPEGRPEPPHEFMPMDNDSEPKTGGQVNALNGLVWVLKFCDTATHDAKVTQYYGPY